MAVAPPVAVAAAADPAPPLPAAMGVATAEEDVEVLPWSMAWGVESEWLPLLPPPPAAPPEGGLTEVGMEV